MRESQLVMGWIKRGEDQGSVKARQADILEAIAVRLQDPVPEDLADAVEGTTDLGILRTWFRATLTASSIAEIRKVMKKT